MAWDDVAEQLKISRQYAEDVARRLQHNEAISEYFELLYEETDNLRFLQLANDVYNCNRFWGFDRFDGHRVYDLTHVNLCHSRFCSNCQKMIQASRLYRFTPELDKALAVYDLYHITFTIPNVPGVKLRTYVRIMARAFKRLVLYLSGRKKIRNIDLARYGFYACLRNLEVTYNNRRNDYHPHYHCIFALSKGLDLPKYVKNEYSYDYVRDLYSRRTQRVYKRSFSDFEILLQKLWRALIEQEEAKTYKTLMFESRLGPAVKVPAFDALDPDPGRKSGLKPKDAPVTRQRLDDMDIGYSCIADKVETDTEAGDAKYYEVFKYAFKLTSDERALMSFQQFETLYFALKGVRTMQGYGAWYNLKCDDEIDDSVNEFYAVFRAYLMQSDDPVRVRLAPADVVKAMDTGDYAFVSRRAIQRKLNDLSEADRAELKLRAAAAPPLPPARFELPDTSAAYYRYLQHKRSSPLFRNLGYVDDPVSGKPVVSLSFEQLAFFPRFFGL